MIPEQQLAQIVARYESIQASMADQANADAQAYVKLSKEYSNLTPVVEAVETYRAAIAEIAGLDEILVEKR